MLIEKESLQYRYNWDSQSTAGNLETLDLTNGNHVLFFINWFFDEHGLISSRNVERIEWLLKKIPCSCTAKKDICSRIRKTWDNFPDKSTVKLALEYRGDIDEKTSVISYI